MIDVYFTSNLGLNYCLFCLQAAPLKEIRPFNPTKTHLGLDRDPRHSAQLLLSFQGFLYLLILCSILHMYAYIYIYRFQIKSSLWLVRFDCVFIQLLKLSLGHTVNISLVKICKLTPAWERSYERESGALTAASTLAGESPLGSANMEITLIMMVSTVWIGSQRSSGFS